MSMLTRGRGGWIWSMVLVLFTCLPVHALQIVDARSPREAERPMRRSTRYIILHTTEAPERSSLNKLRERGEAHYLLTEQGKVYRIMHHRRTAYHAGLSMWEGRENLDNHSIGIEVVGYHDRDITPAQYDALRKLLEELQRIYRIPDDRVLTHSMVAYGRPNRWHKRPHRGRKRCGMFFARDSVRRRLGLHAKPSFDPDVRAGRLVVADEKLARVLYGAEPPGRPAHRAAKQEDGQTVRPGFTPWDIAGPAYNKQRTRYIFPDGREFRGDQIRNWRAIPPGTRVVQQQAPLPEAASPTLRAMTSSSGTSTARRPPVAAMKVFGVDGSSARQLAGEFYNHHQTIYFLPDGRMRRGDEFSEDEWGHIPRQTVVLVGYQYGGRITATRNAYSIRGPRWNCDSTLYRFADGRLIPGSALSERSIPRNAMVFYSE